MKITILSAVILIGFYAQAQEATVLLQDSISDSYKESMENYIQVRFDANTDITEFKFNNRAPVKDFNVLPNESYQARISLGYKWLNLAYSFSPKIGGLNDDEALKGKSTVFGLGLNLSFNKLQQHIFYKKTEGYYLSNSNEYRTELSESGIFGKYALLPDFKSVEAGLVSYYYFNGEKFSSQFARTQSEIQLKSAGSVVAVLGLYYSDIDGSKQQFPFLQSNIDQNLIYPFRNQTYYAVAGAGYAYNYIFLKKFYATAFVYPTIGAQSTRLEFPAGKSSEKNTEMTISGYGEFSLGYNSRSWFGGAYASVNRYTSPTADIKPSGEQTYVMAFIGYRFKAPKPIERSFEWMGSKIKKKN